MPGSNSVPPELCYQMYFIKTFSLASPDNPTLHIYFLCFVTIGFFFFFFFSFFLSIFFFFFFFLFSFFFSFFFCQEVMFSLKTILSKLNRNLLPKCRLKRKKNHIINDLHISFSYNPTGLVGRISKTINQGMSTPASKTETQTNSNHNDKFFLVI